MHISELVLPEWARLRTFLKGIATVRHSSLDLSAVLYTLFYSLFPHRPVWSGCKGFFMLGLRNRKLKTNLLASVA